MTAFREELWKKRELLVNFAISDIKVRYKNSVLGILWSLLEPLLLLGVLYFVFSTMFKIEMIFQFISISLSPWLIAGLK